MEESPHTGSHAGPTPGQPALQSLPLRIVVVSDFGAAATAPRLIPVSKDNLKDVFKDCAVSVAVDVANLLASRPANLQLDIPFHALDDMTPKGLVKDIDVLAAVNALCIALTDYQEGGAPADTLRAAMDVCRPMDALAEPIALCELALSAGAAPAPRGRPDSGRGDGTLDKILDMVEAAPAESGTNDGGGALDRVMGDIAGGTRRPQRSADLDRALKSIRRTLSEQVSAILQYADYQRIESAWRGLHFLIRRTDFRAGIRVELLHAPWDTLVGDFAEAVMEPVLAGTDSVAPALVLLDYPLRREPGEVETLQALAESAARLRVPLVCAVEPAFLGVDSGADLGDLRYAGTLFEQPEYIKWNALRGRDAARWMAVACNRFLLRDPYRADQRHAAGLRESIDGDSEYLWGSPVWAVGALAASSFARCGWPGDISGSTAGQLDNLCLRPLPDHRTGSAPVEALPGADRIQDMADVGLMSLAGQANDDSAYLLRAPMLYGRPNAVGGPGRPDVSLPYQLVAARLNELLAHNHAALAAAATASDAQTAVTKVLSGVLGDTGPGAEIKVTVHGAGADGVAVHIGLRTGGAVLGGASFEFELAFDA